jgi:hypothetical protein
VKDEGESAATTVTGSQGVQVGQGNTQHIYSGPKSPLDPAALSGLNPHSAVARLQRLSHDELLDFFAKAETSQVSEIVDVLREVDLARLTVVLADINRRKATELIESSNLDSRLFRSLPKASEAISRKAASLRWTGAGQIYFWPDGFMRRYDNGCVSTSEKFGTWTTEGAISQYALAHSCGYATDGQKELSRPRVQQQRFRYGTVYSSTPGTFFVTINTCYERHRAGVGWLGLPVGESEENGGLGDLQRFQFGTIYSFVKDGLRSIAVVREIVEILPSDRNFRPVSEESIAKQPHGRGMTVQYFEIEEESGVSETAVYWDEANEPVMVEPEIWSYYASLGAEVSWLGFPARQRRAFHATGSGTQDFEAGTIYWRPGIVPIGVPAEVVRLAAQAPAQSLPLSFPVTEEQPAGANESGRIQFFENGVATLRDGKREIWLRAGSE